MSERLDRIRRRLQQQLAPLKVELTDESHLHAGHAGARTGRGHFRLRIVAAAFAEQTQIQRHRLIYEALDEIMSEEIHALSIEALTPTEAAQRAGR